MIPSPAVIPSAAGIAQKNNNKNRIKADLSWAIEKLMSRTKNMSHMIPKELVIAIASRATN